MKELAPMNAFKRVLYIDSKNLHVEIWQAISKLIMINFFYPMMWYTIMENWCRFLLRELFYGQKSEAWELFVEMVQHHK